MTLTTLQKLIASDSLMFNDVKEALQKLPDHEFNAIPGDTHSDKAWHLYMKKPIDLPLSALISKHAVSITVSLLVLFFGTLVICVAALSDKNDTINYQKEELKKRDVVNTANIQNHRRDSVRIKGAIWLPDWNAVKDLEQRGRDMMNAQQDSDSSIIKNQ
jgi:hypothetical protein